MVYNLPAIVTTISRGTRLLAPQERKKVHVLMCYQAGSTGTCHEASNKELGGDHNERLIWKFFKRGFTKEQDNGKLNRGIE